MRGRIKKNEQSPRSSIKIDFYEQGNSDLLSKIQEIEKRLRVQQNISRRLELKKKSAEEEMKNPEQIEKSLEEQIKQEKQKIKENDEKQASFRKGLEQVESEINEASIKRNELITKYQNIREIRESVNSAEKELQTQMERQNLYLENLETIKNDVAVLEGIERMSQNENMSIEIEELKAETANSQKQLGKIQKEIRSIKSRNLAFQEVYEKWKDKKIEESYPVDTLESFVIAFAQEPKTRQSPQKKATIYHLQELMESNEEMKNQIRKEKRANTKRINQIEQVKNEMKTQTSKAVDKIYKEEQRILRGILLLKEK